MKWFLAVIVAQLESVLSADEALVPAELKGRREIQV